MQAAWNIARPGTALGIVFLATASLFAATDLSPTPNGRGLERLDFRQVVNAAKEKVFPAVIFIKCVRESYERGDKSSQEVSGSGVLISADGEALSNWHVVEKAQQVRCLLYEGRAFEAKVVGADKDTDVALLQLQLPKNSPPLKFAKLGDSTRLTEGDFVMAMGAPWGLARSVSIGIISCTKRYLPLNSEYNCWLQTDASISPGNSGGPLVNTDGEVVGINARGVTMGGDMGFAIPIEVAREVAAQLRSSGKVNWSWTGLQFQPLKDFNRNVYFDANEGVIVPETDPNSPARLAGIQPGDRLVRLNGQTITAWTDEDVPGIRRRFGLLPKNKPTTVELVRKDQTLHLELAPREKGKVEGESLDCPRWDFTVKTINQFDTPDLYFQRNEGVFVFGVKYPGNAADCGLIPRDILLKVDNEPIKTLADVKRIHKTVTQSGTGKNRVVLTVLRNGLLRQVALDFWRNYEKE
jgi:serine protease Do